jgi:outer membrane protein OmpA-like peptidoglycan-associated protein
VLGAGAGIAAWVVVVGGARMWAKLTAVDVPADQTVSVLPRGLLITEGLRTLVVPLLLGGAVAVFVYLSRRAGAEDQGTGRFFAQDELEAKSAAALEECRSGEESAKAAEARLAAAGHWAQELAESEAGDLAVGELRGRLHDAQSELTLAATRFRRVAVLAHELHASRPAEPKPDKAPPLLAAARDASKLSRKYDAARDGVMRIASAVQPGMLSGDVGERILKLKDGTASDAESVRAELRHALDSAGKRMRAGLKSLGPVEYGRWWLRRLEEGSGAEAAVVVVVVLLVVFTAIALVLIDASVVTMVAAAVACAVVVAFCLFLGRNTPALNGAALLVLTLALPIIALAGFVGALGLKYTFYAAALTFLTLWFSSGALRRANGAAATAWILFVAIAFWSGALAFIAQRGSKVTTLDTVAVFQKTPTPPIGGFYLGKTADAVYLASGKPCSHTACRQVISVPLKQVTCVIFGPFAHVKRAGKATDSDGKSFSHPDPSSDLVALAKRGFDDVPATCAGPTSKASPPAKSSKTDDHSKTANSLALLNGLRIMFQRAPKAVPTPAPNINAIGPFTISLSGSSPPTPTSGGGRLVVGSVLFRFGRHGLTRGARSNLKILAREIREAGARHVWVSGHADEKGTFARNVRLAQQRADIVGGALRRRLGTGLAISVHPYGEVMPETCNTGSDHADNRTGRAFNRRAEIRTRRLLTYAEIDCP